MTVGKSLAWSFITCSYYYYFHFAETCLFFSHFEILIIMQYAGKSDVKLMSMFIIKFFFFYFVTKVLTRFIFFVTSLFCVRTELRRKNMYDSLAML